MNVTGRANLEIVKLNVIELKSKPFVLEKAKTKHKDQTPDKQKSSIHKLLLKYYVSTWKAAKLSASSTATTTKTKIRLEITATSTATQTL